MSKTFADAANSDIVKIAVLWSEEGVFKIRRILLSHDMDGLRSLCLKEGASSFKSSAESAKALALLLGSLKGKSDDALEPALATEIIKPFALKVLQTLRAKVPRGRVVSYGRLAELCGSPAASRAAGTAMSGNPFPLFFPCHRVLRINGELGRFGFGSAMKKALLENEGVRFEIDGTAPRSFHI